MANVKPTVYLDLDRTLFQTAKVGEVWRQVEQLYNEVDAAAEHDRLRDYYRYAGDQYYYDFAAQLGTIGLSAATVYRQLLESPLADGRLEFPGVAELLTAITPHAQAEVLTFGADDYQRLKAALCPSLQGVPVRTLLGSKASWLVDKGDCWLVDDRPLGNSLPANVSFIQVSLEGGPVEPQGWPVLTSLRGVKDHLIHNIDKT